MRFIGAWFEAVYGLVAANRRFVAGPAGRVFWLKTAVILAFCIGLSMSSHLWVGPRSYPAIPVFTLLPAIDGFVADCLFAASFVLSAAILIAPKPRRLIAALLAILALFSWKSDDTASQQRTLNIARLVIASTYVLSGLQKLNLNFIDVDFPWVVGAITKVFPLTANAFHVFGMSIPLVQVGFGVGLLTRRFRGASLIVAVSMHAFILAMFGPAGLDWNSIVWPWTAAMAVFDILLFSGNVDYSWREVIWSRGHLHHAAVFVLLVVLPLSSFFNLWDSYLSSALYSGNLTEAQIYTTDAGKRALPEAIGRYLVHTSPDTNVLNIQRWAIEDLNVTPYPETRVFRPIVKSVCSYLRDPAQLVLLVQEQRMFFSRPESGYRCWQL
jgi:hypothetical protein